MHYMEEMLTHLDPVCILFRLYVDPVSILFWVRSPVKLTIVFFVAVTFFNGMHAL